MSDGINQRITEYDSISSILSYENFLSLDKNIQNKIIDNVHTDKETEGGIMGKFLGTNVTNVAMHITFIICCSLLIIIGIDMNHSYSICEPINMNLIGLIIPVITLSLGYIFGRGSSN